MTPADLETLRLELGERMTSTIGRVSELEKVSQAAKRTIAVAAPSIVFLQGSYGFREVVSNRLLRSVLTADGRPLLLPNGLPVLSPDGNGSIAEKQFVGSGFVIGDDGLIITNRHVALPWELDGGTPILSKQGFTPEVIKLVGYRPTVTSGVGLAVVKASEKADLAVLKFLSDGSLSAGLQLAETPPEPGDEVILMGYPTGLRSLLAQAGEGFVGELQEAGDTDFWSVSERLAKSQLIVPLASRGIIGRTSAESVVYDAETTHGGSGGPVLNSSGKVVAVNTAILPEFGGSNIGIPAVTIRQFLAEREGN